MHRQAVVHVQRDEAHAACSGFGVGNVEQGHRVAPAGERERNDRAVGRERCRHRDPQGAGGRGAVSRR